LRSNTSKSTTQIASDVKEPSLDTTPPGTIQTLDAGYTDFAVLLTAGAVIALIGQSLTGILPQSEKWKAYLFTVMGLAFFLIAGRAFTRGRFDRWFGSPLERLSRWFSMRPYQAMLFFLAPILSLAARVAAGDGPLTRSAWLATGTWIFGIACIVVANWRHGQRISLPPNSRRDFLIAGILFLAALLLRVLFVGQVPWLLTGDEGSGGLSAVAFISGRLNNLFSIGWYSFPSLYFYVQSLSIRLFGQTVLALRVPSTLAGAMTVFALYFLVRDAFGRWAAILSASYLAAFHFHIHFSRLGINNIWDGLFVVAFSALLWHAWEFDDRTSGGRRMSFVMAGIALGLAQYFYTSSRALFVMLPIWLVFAAIKDRQAVRNRLPGIVAMLMAALTVFLPLALFFVRHPNEFSAPMNRVTIFGRWMENEIQLRGVSQWSIFVNQIVHSALGFTSENLRAWYQPDHPMLLALPSALFLLGLVLLLPRILDLRVTWLALWLVAAVVAGAFSQNPPSAQRYVFAAPLVAFLVGFPLAEVGGWLARAWPKRRAIPQVVLSAVLIVAILGDLDFYFADYSFNRRFGDFNTETATALGYYLADQEPGLEVYFFGAPRMGYTSLSTVPYLAPLAVGHDVLEPITSPPDWILSGQTAFIFLPERLNELDLVRQEYPDGNELSIRGKKDALLFTSYLIE
jgi:4-amino-4-deoxy-L-arabinose transferase-like glycosyltransferase